MWLDSHGIAFTWLTLAIRLVTVMLTLGGLNVYHPVLECELLAWKKEEEGKMFTTVFKITLPSFAAVR